MRRTQEEMEAIVEPSIVEAEIDQMIYGVIMEYNAEHGVAFKGINTVQKYLIDVNYPHYAFCSGVLVWNITVWEEARTLQTQIALGEIPKPTLEEFMAMLPEYVA